MKTKVSTRYASLAGKEDCDGIRTISRSWKETFRSVIRSVRRTNLVHRKTWRPALILGANGWGCRVDGGTRVRATIQCEVDSGIDLVQTQKQTDVPVRRVELGAERVRVFCVGP